MLLVICRFCRAGNKWAARARSKIQGMTKASQPVEDLKERGTFWQGGTSPRTTAVAMDKKTKFSKFFENEAE